MSMQQGEKLMSVLIQNVLHRGGVTDVFIEGNRFQSIGPNLAVQADTVLDGTDKAIVPSLYNCHTHAAMTLLRGYADDMELHSWLTEHIWPLEGKMTREDIYRGARLACLEMIRSGTTFFSDMYWHWEGTAQAVEEMGIRGALSGAFFDFGDRERAEAGMAQVRDLHARSREYSDRIVYTLGPHAIYTVSTDALRTIKEYALENGLLLHIHVSETVKEVEDCIAMHGKRPVAYLDEIGFLGPDVLAAHVIHVDQAEMDILADRQVKVVHCPASNMKLCSGMFPYAGLAGRNIPVALGTDGCSSNNNLDMLEEMKIAGLRAKVGENDPTLYTSQELFASATSVGAAMFGIDAGEIAEGKLADCLLIDLDHPQMVPNHNLISNLVYSGNGGCVDTTICNGRVLMQARHVEGEEEILAEVRESVTRLTGRRA
jgi:5-methylthioadenosine/S-adenosylhomocysteine deaminase